MHLEIVDNYPSIAAFGCDFFTRAAIGDVRMEGPDGEVHRREKVLVTDRTIDFEGRVCIGERTVRHLAHRFDMVDGWRVERIKDDNTALRAELVELSTELASVRSQLTFARQLETQPAEQVFLSLDGTKHASARACMEATAKLLDVPTKIISDATPRPLLETEEVTA